MHKAKTYMGGHASSHRKPQAQGDSDDIALLHNGKRCSCRACKKVKKRIYKLKEGNSDSIGVEDASDRTGIPVKEILAMVKHNAIEGKELSDSKGNSSWVVDKMSMARFMLCPQNRRRAVYFIGAPLLGMVKIGVAKNPYKRIDELQTGSPEILHMVGMYPLEGRECEKEFHERFAEYRAHGEWFRDEGELRRFLEKEFRNGNE